MAKPKVTPTPDGREINLKSRQCKVTNLNLKPEISGKDQVSRCDVSIEFLLADKDVAQILDVEGGADLLWNDAGEPILREVGDAWIELDLVALGEVSLGPVRGKGVDFNGRMKKVLVQFSLRRELIVKAQLRFEPTGELEMLERCHVARVAKFSFKGAVMVNASPDGEDPKDDGQEKLL